MSASLRTPPGVFGGAGGIGERRLGGGFAVGLVTTPYDEPPRPRGNNGVRTRVGGAPPSVRGGAPVDPRLRTGVPAMPAGGRETGGGVGDATGGRAALVGPAAIVGGCGFVAGAGVAGTDSAALGPALTIGASTLS